MVQLCIQMGFVWKMSFLGSADGKILSNLRFFVFFFSREMTNRITKYKRQPPSCWLKFFDSTRFQNIKFLSIRNFNYVKKHLRHSFQKVFFISQWISQFSWQIDFQLTFVGAASAILQLFDNAIFHCTKLYHFIDGLLVIILEVTTHRTQNVGQVIFHQENF